MEMNQYAFIQSVAEFFNLGAVTMLDPTPIGNGNSSYFVQAADGQEYVIRFLRNQTIKGLKNERIIQEQLIAAGIPTTTMITNHTGAYVYEKENVLATISKKLVGIHPKNKNREIAYSTGVLLAKFHQAVLVLDHTSQGWLNKDRAIVDSKKLSEESSLTPVIRNMLYENIKIFDVELPEGIIHGDLYIANMLFEEDRAVVIFDFEESEKNLYIVDIARTLCSSVCIQDGKIDPVLMQSLIQGYESIRLLTTDEKKYLPMAIRYECAAACVWYQLHQMHQQETFYIGIGEQIKDSEA